jgi:hypothetical protein
MNYYANFYNDDYNPEDIKIHMHVIEGIYELNFVQKARRVGDVNITENKFLKHVKRSDNVVNIGENTITLKYMGEWTLLSHLLITAGYTPERIEQITTAINNISNNTSIKTNQNCYGEWINF